MNKGYEQLLQIARLLKNAGGRALLAGGCVRDRLSGVIPEDFDLEVYGISASGIIRALEGSFALDPVGMSFGVLKVRHFPIDIALPRLESKTGRGHRGFMVEPRADLDFRTASARRDFTVNAMMLDPLTGEIIDPHGGRADLQKGILRHVSPHFGEDPLRVLRGMQFIGRFGFTAAGRTVELCRSLSQDELASERIAAEWEKLLLKGKNISAGLRFLKAAGWLKFYPELAALDGCPQDPRWHPEGDVWEHTLAVADAAVSLRRADKSCAMILMLAALCHDFGKPACTVQTAERISSAGHDTFTAPAETFIGRCWKNRDLTAAVIKLIRAHMQVLPLILNNSSDRAFRRLALAVGRMDLLADLAECDVRGIASTAGELQRKLELVAAFRSRIAAVLPENAPPVPLIMGRHLLARGVAPGQGMQPILKKCFDAQLDGEFSDLDGALAYLDSLL